jgi:hypothetical protein
LNLRHIKKILLFHSMIVQNISSIKKKEKIEKQKKIVQKDDYWFLLQKTKQEKIRSNQLRISLHFILQLLGS